ncbi:hypothetical protein P154DRAFT_516764 [Amniculicola lignicola CBS 123094]|uniref:Integral membrane protein n=1 Tax=Amniculicola lignicola CBS 123094 TaxID=1392246 RepID=A0A6A5X4Z9_9PLEO|nr:hypothetical protein P154DRAFT_516764 [Amniculicola lignicola CBS 123094]
MDKLRSARNRVAERASTGRGTGSLSVPQSSLPPSDNASVVAVNEGIIGPQSGPTARDFAAPSQPTVQLVAAPPTSLQSSVDAGEHVPLPSQPGSSSRATASSSHDTGGLRVPINTGRARSNSAPNRPQNQTPRPSMGIRHPSIGIRRVPSSQALRQNAADSTAAQGGQQQLNPKPSGLATLDETCQLDTQAAASSSASSSTGEVQEQPSRLRRASNAFLSTFRANKEADNENEKDTNALAALHDVPENFTDFNPQMVDVLDTLDPEIQTLTSLTNVQNSLFIPNLGRWVNRRPTYTLRQAPSEAASLASINRILEPMAQTEEVAQPPRLQRTETEATMATLATIDSRMSDSRFAVLPHGTQLSGWSKEDKNELNDHVRHMLHSKRSKFKRSMRGFGQYASRPLGFLVTLYATLITLFGLAWVLFLIGWINVGGRKEYVVHIIDSVLVALFAIVGDGLAPFRAVDTYHMIYIAHYHHFTWSRRKKQLLPALKDHNDLPASNAPIANPIDSDDPEKQWEFTVLTPTQQKKLEHHQAKFIKSHSFYKPHETDTHYAFPLRLLIAIVVLLDCHSLLQISLGACTWGIYYKDRPFAITTVILCCSITCNATAGLLISVGDHKTRKKDVLERMNRQELTDEAIHKIEKKKEKESESEREGEDSDGKKRSMSAPGRRSLNLIRGKKEKEASAYP